jgi:hypothetical protein
VSSGPHEPVEAADPAGAVDSDAGNAFGPFARRLVAATAAGVLVALVVCDQWAPSVRSWWGHRPFTTDVVSSLLVLAVTVLIIDEVVARRQRKDRAASVAVQGLILYDQALRSYESVMSGLSSKVDEDYTDEAKDEVRGLAAMILVASPSLFDDPEARLFLEELQRMTGLLYQVVALVPARFVASARVEEQAAEAGLKASKARLDARITPLAARLSWQDRGSLAEATDPSSSATPGSSTTLPTSTGGRTDRDAT